MRRTMMSRRCQLPVVIALWLLLVLPAQAEGKRFALLIGVADYAEIGDLKGPLNDVAELEKVALSSWQLPAENITTLVDGQATRKNILAAMDQLNERTRAGDWVFVYFSGHGTSSQGLQGKKLRFADLPDDSGAFIPADFRRHADDGSPLDSTSLVAQMLVGRWDLKPRLMALDQKGVESFVVIDACFSENAFRDLAPSVDHTLSRFVPLADVPAGSAKCNHCKNSEAVRSYNYQNTVIFYASANDQTAEDITELSISSGNRTTLSNKAHGLFSDSLLRALDQLDEGQSSFEDLFQATKRHLHNNCGGKCRQDPGSIPLPEENTLALLSRRVVAGSPVARAPVSSCRSVARSISIHRGFSRLREIVSRNSDYRSQDHNADIQLQKHNEDWAFFTRGGAKIVDLNQVEDYFGEWLANRSWLDVLDCEVDLRKNDFAITLRNGDGLHGDVALPEVPLYFSVNLGERSRILLLDINPQGEIFVLFPFYPSELKPFAKAEPIYIPGLEKEQTIEVAPPFGQDSVWLIAFADEADLPLLQGFQQAADIPLDTRGTLMKRLRQRLNDPGGVAQRRVNIFTLRE